MRNDDPELDRSAAEELPERESDAGVERAREDRDGGGIEREAVEPAGEDAGVESPPRDADRADLLP